MSGLAGKRVLILEDEFLLALEAAEALEEIGLVVIGPAHRVEVALALIAADVPDAALLDVNIGGATSERVAAELHRLQVPVVFATGYGAQAGVAEGSVVLDKPYRREAVQAAIRQVLEG